MGIRDNEFDIIDNEFDIPEPNPLDNLAAFLAIGNAQYFLDEHYKETTKPLTHKIGAFILTELKDLRTHAPLLRMFGF